LIEFIVVTGEVQCTKDYVFYYGEVNKKRYILMSICLIIFGLIIFLFGFVTPVSDFYTLPISVIVIVIGIIRLIKNQK
jgi:uncharacterized membrane protein YhaH (DUF805 family)